MKKIVFNLFLICFFVSLTGTSYSQSFKLEKVNQTDLTKINNPFDAVSDGLNQLDGPNPPSTQAAIITPISGASTSANGRSPQSSTRYQRCYYFISADEMTSSFFPVGSSITSLGFSYSVASFAAAADTFKVFFQNGPATFVDKGANWPTAIAPMTQVHQGPISTIGAPGSIDYTLNNSGAFSYTGSGLWVAFEFQNITGTTGAANTALCNTVLPAPVLRNMSAGSNVALNNTMSNSSNFRPVTRLGTASEDIVIVNNVIAMGEKINNCIDTNQYVTNFTHLRPGIDTLTYKIVVKNVSSGFIKDSSSFTFILNDTGATTSYFITSSSLKTDSIKTDSVIATVTAKSGEQIVGNNSGKTTTSSTYNTMNQAITSATNSGGAGFTNAGNLEIAIAHNTGNCDVYISKVNYIFGSTGQPYLLKVYEGNVNTPGTLLYTSDTLTNSTGANSHTLSSPVKSTSGKFFIALRQINTTNFSLQYQREIPVRRNVYYTGDGTPGDWGESLGGFKYNVQVVTTVNLDLGLYLEGFFNGTTMIGDTVRVNLRSQSSPYPIIDTDQAYVNSTGNGTFNFTNASPNTCYYYEVIHRNHIVTYSNASCNTLNDNTNSFNFKSAGSQALGSNQVLVGSSYSTYTADVNQDGVVDVTDYSITDNDANNFVAGYVVTDVNGDEVVDVADLGYCDNNAANFVGAIVP